MKFYLCVAALLVLPAAASAQSNPGPFGGLFGRTPNRTGVDYKVFEIRGSGGAQWDDGLFEPSPEQAGQVSSGALGNAAAAATFERRSDRLNLRAGSTVDYRQTLRSRPIGGTSVDGGLLFSARLTTRVTAEATADYRYSPYFEFYPSFVWLDDGMVVPGLPFLATAVDNHVGRARVSGSFQYSKRSTLTASAVREESQFSTTSANTATTTRYEGLWQSRLNRDFALRLGYGRSLVRYRTSAVAEFLQEEIDAGVDFNRALTLVPRTTIAFTTSTSILRHNGERRNRLNGSFTLSHRFRRTWQTSFNATRETQFVAGLVEPLFVDMLALSVSGLLADRVEWITTLNGGRGDVGFDGAHGEFARVGGLTQLNIAVTRRVGIYTQYGLYYHDVPTRASSIVVPDRLSRQMFSTGITAWLPVFTRERTASDSR